MHTSTGLPRFALKTWRKQPQERETMKYLKPLTAVGVLFPAIALSLCFMSGCEGQEKKYELVPKHVTPDIQTLLDSNEQLKQKIEEMGRTIKSMERANNFAQAGIQLLAEVELIKRECPVYLKNTYKVSSPILYVDYEPGLMSDRTGYVFTGCRIYRKEILAKDEAFAFVSTGDLKSALRKRLGHKTGQCSE
jgi:outer membrane murein-binding lipoprotein Lpp